MTAPASRPSRRGPVLAIVALVVVVAGAAGLWYLFFRPSGPAPVALGCSGGRGGRGGGGGIADDSLGAPQGTGAVAGRRGVATVAHATSAE